ncbi:MAG: methyl-accepting chemotaxis protein [Deltaproteobacteria bacterium]|nr:methyl-accepting chemotaxis protein [Deltaproteobacteria bacterium]
MNLQSVKTRFMGSYLFLVILFVIQIPIIYWLVSGMIQKYAQVEEAGGLRKRAIEITEVLNRHIMTGNEELEKVFQAKKEEFGKILEDLKKGSKDLAPLKDAELLAKLGVVENKWMSMRSVFDGAMENGDKLRETKEIIGKSTFTFAARLNEAGSPSAAQLAVKQSYFLEKYLTSYSDRDAVGKELQKSVSDFDDRVRQLRKNDLNGLWEQRKKNIETTMAASDRFQAQMTELTDHHTREIVAAANELTALIAAEARSSALKGLTVMIVSVFISGVIAILFMWSTNSQIIRPIIRIKEAVEELAKGELTNRANVKVSFLGKDIKDEITDLSDSVDAMAVQMSEVIGRITDSSNHLASACEQLSSSSTQIAEGADRQSSQTAHVATAMEEMNATVIEVAKSSQQASDSARTAQDIASRGGEVVTQAIVAMKEVAASTSVTADTIKKLGKSSEEIGTIVSVINDIADQTNLLALNAAIEAARAGEQGRGFAVVADEVRKLAERTTKATKEISDMIRSIQDETNKAVGAMASGTVKVENGVKLANEAGNALKQIVTGVENVTDMIGHIATSAEEQSSTTDEITRNMDSIAGVAKSNVSAISEVANATNELARLATELKDLVANFRIARDEGAPELRVISGSAHKKTHLKKEARPKAEPHLKKIENA